MPEKSIQTCLVDARELCSICDPATIPFESTIAVKARTTTVTNGLIGQDRALGAMKLSAKMQDRDFNVFVMGNAGSGRKTAIRSTFEAQAQNRETPSDWAYVNNFDEPHRPHALEMPPGMAKQLKSAMEDLVNSLASDLPALFDSETYQNQRRDIDQKFGEEQEEAFGALMKSAREKNVAVMRTPMGFAVAAMEGAKALSPEEFEALDDKVKAEFDERVASVRKELEAVLKQAPKKEKARRKSIEELDERMAKEVIDSEIAEAISKLPSHDGVREYLEKVQADLAQNVELFLLTSGDRSEGPLPVASTKHFLKPEFHRYAVNLMISHETENGSCAPVIEENLPTVGNLIGRVEHISEMGALTTNFTMIKPGSLHRANGGYLVLDARSVLSEPLAWEALKRCLKTGQISIVSPGEMLSLVSTISLEPEPIPLNIRISLIGERVLYYLLVSLDPDFARLFKVQADFNDEVVRSEETVKFYAHLVAEIAQRSNIKPLDATAVAQVLQEATRVVEDADRMSLNIGFLSDVLREADFWASEADQKIITAKEILRAIDEAESRASRIKELSYDAIQRQTILIDTTGSKVGQINALSVIGTGGYRFGRPSRITARVRMGTGKVIDIEREVDLGGSIHSKGVMILSSYLASHFALDVPMSLWASIAFEQSYGGVDGDSASAAECFTLISALSGVAINQSFAVTGSINQLGQIQAIGGVNEKIEGFFDICAARGLTGEQGVLIPKANVRSLALRKRVIDAVEKGEFRIFAIETLEEGLEILMGTPAGVRGATGDFPSGSINFLAEERLRAFAHSRKSFNSSKNENDEKRASS